MGLCCQIVIWDIFLSTSHSLLNNSTLSLPPPSSLQNNPLIICLSTPSTSKPLAPNLPDSLSSHHHKLPQCCLSNINHCHHYFYCWPISAIVKLTTSSSLLVTSFTIDIQFILTALSSLYLWLSFLVINHGKRIMASFGVGVTFICSWGTIPNTCIPSFPLSWLVVPGCTTCYCCCSAYRRSWRQHSSSKPLQHVR